MTVILKKISSGPAETNSYLIACAKTKEAAVVDVPFGAAESLVNLAKELSVTIKWILLTHSHWDHIAEVSALKRTTAAQIWIHREDALNLQHPGSDKLPLLFPIVGANPDGYFEEGQLIEVGNLTIKVIHTPGHTPGGVCFHLESEKILISGDTLFRGSIGNVSFPTANPKLMLESLMKLSKLPSDTSVFPGHGPETTIGREQKTVEFVKQHLKETSKT